MPKVRGRPSRGAAVLVAAAGMLATGAASGQDITRGETVLERARPDLDPLGVRLGGFILYPDLGVRETYESNIFATEDDEEDDFITSIEPSWDLRSDWNNHALSLHLDARSLFYADHPDENLTDYTAALDGRLDVRRNIEVFGGGGFRVRHEDRSSPDDVGGQEPTEYHNPFITIGGATLFNRLSVKAGAAFDRFNYQEVDAGGGGSISNAGRDRNQTQISLQTGYVFQPLREVFLRGTFDWRNYDDSGGVDRDSTGFEIVVGADYDLTGITSIEAFVGYREQDYTDSSLEDISGVSAGANLIWNVTRLTTVTGGLARTIEESTLTGASGYFATRFDLRVDHELRRNILLNARLGYGIDDYRGIDRQDNYFTGGLGATYQMNRYFSLSGGYTYRQRASDAGGDYDDNLVMIRLGARL